jgi:hypothetical protein
MEVKVRAAEEEFIDHTVSRQAGIVR